MLKVFTINKSQVCIVIPIYKEILNDFEVQSVLQCIKILTDYSIYFIAPEGLDMAFYITNFPTISKTVFFDKKYFIDLKGYNKLMLDLELYKCFNDFEYMLVHQTDCFVFRDELLDWAKKDFDYIGGIWFEGFIGNPHLGSKLWLAGNGGFSLRKIKSITRLLTSTKPLLNMQQLIIEKMKLYKNGKINFIKELFLFPFNIFGYQNNYKYHAKMHGSNEDFFFIKTDSKYKGLNIPDVEEAMLFSWDRYPAFLYEKVGQLPFACHAWFREDFLYEGNAAFWSKHIKTK